MYLNFMIVLLCTQNTFNYKAVFRDFKALNDVSVTGGAMVNNNILYKILKQILWQFQSK